MPNSCASKRRYKRIRGNGRVSPPSSAVRPNTVSIHLRIADTRVRVRPINWVPGAVDGEKMKLPQDPLFKINGTAGVHVRPYGWTPDLVSDGWKLSVPEAPSGKDIPSSVVHVRPYGWTPALINDAYLLQVAVPDDSIGFY